MSNASPLIALCRADLISLLPELLSSVAIPAPVVEEIHAGPEGDPARQWLDNQAWANIVEISPPVSALGSLSLGKGESAVIEWALRSKDCIALLDDRAARRVAVALGIPVCGTLGLLARATRLGFLDSFTAATDALSASGFYLDPHVITAIRRGLDAE